MPVLSSEELRQIGVAAPFATRAPIAPSSEGAAGAAMRLENPVVALSELYNRPTFAPDEEFDLGAALKARPDVADNNRKAFIGTRSQAEFDYRAAKVAKENADRQTLAAAGLPGVLYAIGAGLASPTTLLPVIGATRALKAGTAAGRVLGTAGAVGASSAGAIALDEAALRASSLTRTDLETALAVGGGAVLGGALGGLLGRLAPDVRARAVAEIEGDLGEPDLTRALTPDEADELVRAKVGGDLSAAEVGSVRYVGGVEDLTRAGRAIGEMSPAVAPSVRAQSEYGLRTAAAVQQNISTGGLRVTTQAAEDSPLGLREAVAPGGQLEASIRATERRADATIQTLIEDAWVEIEGLAPGIMRSQRAEAAAILTGRLRKPTRMTFAQMSEELMLAMHRGDKSDVPEIEKAAKRIRELIIAPLTEAAQRAGLLPEELSEEMLSGAKSYLMRVYDHDMMRTDPEGFKGILIANAAEKQKLWVEKRFTELQKKIAEAEEDLADRSMELDAAAQLREELKAEVEALSTGPRALAVEEVAQLRREAKDAKKLAEGLSKMGDFAGARDLEQQAEVALARAKALRERNEDVDRFKGEKARLTKRMANLNKTVFKLQEREQKAIEDADKIFETIRRDVINVSKRVMKARDKLASADDATFDKLLDDTFKQLFRMLNQIEARELRQERLADRFPELTEAPAEFSERVQRFKLDVFEAAGIKLETGERGTKRLSIKSEAEKKSALEAIDAVLEEGEVKRPLLPLKENETLIIHGGSDFDEIDPRFFGTGEPGNIRPLGNGLYAYELKLDDQTKLEEALAGAANYANKYGKGNKTLHVFRLQKDQFDFTSNGPILDGFKISQERAAVGDLFARANSLPVGPERSAAFDAANAAYEKLPKPTLRGEKLPGGLNELAVMDGAKLERIGKLSTTASTAELNKLLQGSVKFQLLNPAMQRSLRAWRDDIASLRWSDEVELAKAEGRFERNIALNAEAELRAEGLQRRFEALRTLDRDAVRAGLDAELQNLAGIVAKKQSKRGAREAALRARAEKIRDVKIPETEEQLKQLADLPRRLAEEFREKLRLRGAEWEEKVGPDGRSLPDPATIDFTPALRERADELFAKIAGEFVRTPGIDIVAGEKGPALARLIDVDLEQKYNVNGREVSMKDFMVKDISAVLRSYVRTIVPDTKLAERFNDGPGLGRWFGNSQSELHREYAHLQRMIEEDKTRDGKALAKPRSREEKEKLQQQLSADFKYAEQALGVLVNRLRHTDGLPADPSSVASRAVRTWRMAQVPMYMGMVAVSSIPEVLFPVMKYGVANAFRDSWAPLVSNFKEWMRAASEAAKAGQGLDPQLNTRFMAFNDMEEMNIRYTRFEKLVEFFATKTGTVAMFDYWTKFSKMLAAPMANGQLMRALEHVMTGAKVMPRDKALDVLAQAGINDEIANRMWAQLQEHGYVRGKAGAIIPDTDKWNDYKALEAYRAYMSRELDITTITPGVERPMWVTANEFTRTINQFRSFGWSATTKMMLAGMQQRDIAVAQAYLAMLALGTVSYAGWAMSFGPGTKQWEEFMNADAGKFADEAIYRSGLLAIFSEVHGALSDINGLRPLLSFSEQGAERLRDPDLAGTLLGVSASTAKKIAAVLGGLDDPTQTTSGNLRKLMFYNNVWYMRRLFMEAEGGAAQALGLPERRGG